MLTRANGDFLPYSVWQRRHTRLIADAGVKRITIHGLRHTNTTLELEAGVNPKIVQERLGHKHVSTTLDIYSHLSVGLQRDAAEALDKRISG